MALLIDPPAWPGHGRLWSHLVSDSSLAELHAFARVVGLPERSFDADHYDVVQERYATVVAAGAQPVSRRELLDRLRASGLRVPKRKGERLLDSRPGDDGWVREVLSSPVDHSHELVPGGRDLVVTAAGVVEAEGATGLPCGFSRRRRGTEVVVTGVLRVADGVPGPDPAHILSALRLTGLAD